MSEEEQQHDELMYEYLKQRTMCELMYCYPPKLPPKERRLLLIKQIPCFKPPPFSGMPNLRPQMIGYQALKAKHLLPQVDPDEFPFDLDHETTIVGSFGGVTCLFANERSSIVLMKPHNITAADIREVSELRIPAPEGRRCGFYPCFYGIGYGSTMNDHKIVLGEESLVRVYSVKSDSWSVFSGSFCGFALEGFPIDGRGCYMMGALHWLLPAPDDDDDDGDSGSDSVAECKKSLLVAFNLGLEEFTILKTIDRPGAFDAGVGPFGNHSLFYYICSPTRKDDSDPIVFGACFFELWVLEDYRRRTWVKVGEIHPEDLPGRRVTWFTPIFIALNGEVVLQSRGCTVFYSLTENKILSHIDGVEDAAIVEDSSISFSL